MPHPPLNDRKLPHVPGLHLKLVSDGLALLDEQTSRKPMRSQLGCQADRDHDLPGLRLGIAWETHESSDPALMLYAGARSSADSGLGSASSRNGSHKRKQKVTSGTSEMPEKATGPFRGLVTSICHDTQRVALQVWSVSM